MKTYCILLLAFLCACSSSEKDCNRLRGVLELQVLSQASMYMGEDPVTVTAFIAARSAGTSHDFFSEGDYWWPDTLDAGKPYIRRDGETNPGNFVAHRHAMIRFSMIVGNLTSAYLLTGDEKYVNAAMKHVRAWFMNEETRMNPHLLYAQAIYGITTGRGIGIIDTIHLIEVVQSLIQLEKRSVLTKEELDGTKQWFREYLHWLTTHSYGIDEMNATNNHGTCWVMQAAIYAKYVGDNDMLKCCSERFKNVLLPQQMDENGSFPLELSRTKPYGYSLFNLDALATLCRILTTEEDNLWEYTTPDGKNLRKGIDFLLPYVVEKSKWPYEADVMYWHEWPVAQPAFLFAWAAYGGKEYYNAWVSREHFPTNDEVIRNLPVRNPVIWFF